MNPLSISNNANNSSHNHTNLTDCEFYSNVTNPQMFTNNSHSASEAGFYNNHNNNISNVDSFPNPHSFNQNHNFYNSHQENEDFSNEAALAAANAAFNSPFLNNAANMNNQTLLNSNGAINNEPSFLRHTIRPKPIAIPLNATTNISNQMGNISSETQTGMFSVNSAQRKSFKNLPIATATLISSNNNNTNNSQSNNAFFNDLNAKQVS